MRIVAEPYLVWHCVTVLLIAASWDNQSWWPIIIWIGVNLLMLPLCLWLREWNGKQGQTLADEVSDDPYIQQKYSRRGRE